MTYGPHNLNQYFSMLSQCSNPHPLQFIERTWSKLEKQSAAQKCRTSEQAVWNQLSPFIPDAKLRSFYLHKFAGGTLFKIPSSGFWFFLDQFKNGPERSRSYVSVKRALKLAWATLRIVAQPEIVQWKINPTSPCLLQECQLICSGRSIVSERMSYCPHHFSAELIC